MPHPCDEGLTAACFAAAPQWAKQAFAVRLMSALVPPSITRRLPKWKFRTNMIFPPGWTPGDLLPAGITEKPGVTFPPGWTPGDDLPSDITWQPALPPGAETSGPISPTFLDPATPGPRPPAGGIVKKEYTIDILSYNTDGVIWKTGPNWALLRSADTGDGNSTDDGFVGNAAAAHYDFGGYFIERAFFEFSLSGIPANADIVSAVLTIRGWANADSKVCIQKGTGSGTLSNDDFDAYSGWYIDFVDWAAGPHGAYGINEFKFLTINLAWLESKFGSAASIVMREYDHDYQNMAPTPVLTYYQNGCVFRDYADQSQVPILTIVYEA